MRIELALEEPVMPGFFRYPPRVKISFTTTVVSCSERFKHINYRPDPADSREWIHDQVSLGWFLHLEGSRESIYVGETDPGFKKGDCIAVTMEKIDVAAQAS